MSYQEAGLFWAFGLCQISTDILARHQCLVPVHHLKSLLPSRVISVSDLGVQKLEASSFAVHPTFRTDEGREGGWRLSGDGCGWSCGRCLCWLLNSCLAQDPVQVGLSPVFISIVCLYLELTWYILRGGQLHSRKLHQRRQYRAESTGCLKKKFWHRQALEFFVIRI